jgi:hypothetical protein
MNFDLKDIPQDKLHTTTVLINELTDPATGIYKMPTDNNAKNKHIVSIAILIAEGSALTPMGKPLATAQTINRSFFTLVKDGKKVLDKIPLSMMAKCNVENPQFGYILNQKDLDFTDSQIDIADYATVTPGEQFMFVFTYFTKD